MDHNFIEHLRQSTATLKGEGLFKSERILTSPQGPRITTDNGRSVVNLCANNYLGLAGDRRLVEAGKRSLETHGYGLASVRFICGTQSIHKKLESRISQFLGMDDTILYSSCFDANGGLFETLLGEDDAIISDELNHASIIDGIRLSKARRYRYRNNDMADLEARLKEARDARFRMIATDGVFSMDGTLAKLDQIVDLADQYHALVMVDDSHAVGFIGENGRGTHEYFGVMDKVDIITGTLGKALGGGSGGYTSGHREIIEWLRQRSRPYLFSNTLAPMIAGASVELINLLETSGELRERLTSNAAYFRSRMTQLGFNLIPGYHPIIPVMIGDAIKAKKFADALLDEGLYVIAFSYPVVPHGKARIRTQMSAAHSKDDLNLAIQAFEKVGRLMGVIQ